MEFAASTWHDPRAAKGQDVKQRSFGQALATTTKQPPTSKNDTHGVVSTY